MLLLYIQGFELIAHIDLVSVQSCIKLTDVLMKNPYSQASAMTLFAL